MSEMKITAIAPWFGGKRTLAPEIVKELGPHRAYWEPFCGGMSVLLSKPPCSMETVNDLHGDLTNIARVVKDRSLGPVFYRRLRRALLSEPEMLEAFDYLDTQPLRPGLDIERAYAYFCASWMMRSGIAGTDMRKRGAGRSISVRYTANGGAPATRWRNAIDSIPAWRERLRNVMVLTRDAFEILGKIDDQPQTAIYLDPPYLPETRSGLKGSGAVSRYLHDFDTHGGGLVPDDHHRLADALRRFKKARIVLSYYQCDRLAELYPGWTCRQFDVAKAMAHQAARGENSVRATEVLLINGPSLVEPTGNPLALGGAR
jgi:DNA adenine methylase